MPLYLRLPEVVLRFVVADSAFKVPLDDFVVRVSFHVSLSFVTQLFASGRPLPLLWTLCPSPLVPFRNVVDLTWLAGHVLDRVLHRYVFSFSTELATPQAVRPCECSDDGAG